MMRVIKYALILFLIYLDLFHAQPLKNSCNYEDNEIVKLFREYLQIDTSKHENIELAIQFWRRQAMKYGLTFKKVVPDGRPICIISLEGTNDKLPSIMLNSHMDVVPVEVEKWQYPPFSAYVDENCDIFARGAQDDKDVTVQYFSALKYFKEHNITLQRSLYMTLMPDEETGGHQGMTQFLKTDYFKNMNVGFAMDEGLPSAGDTVYVSYLDKRPWQMVFTVTGAAGHGSLIPDDTAIEKAARLINKIHEARNEQKNVVKSLVSTDYGNYRAINVNILRAGAVPNVIPSKVDIAVDMRLATNDLVSDMHDMVSMWMKEAGKNTTVKFLRKIDKSLPTVLNDANPYWVAMRDTANEMGLTLTPVVLPAASDVMYLRNMGIPAVGFSPKTKTISRIHSHNEYLNVQTLLKGVDIYINMLRKFGNLP